MRTALLTGAGVALLAFLGLVGDAGTGGARSRVVSAAESQIGPQDPAKYWADVLPGHTEFKGAWCGGFALWCLHQAGLALDIGWSLDQSKPGFCYHLPPTSSPKPGDIAYVTSKQHHAIVERVDGDTIHTIDGNQAGGEVARRERPRSAFGGFYSIEPLLAVAA